MQKEFRSIDTLRNWDKNPRAIKKDKFEELKRRITKRGQFKPLIITPDGEVLGGNMRLRAMKELGVKDVWVSVVEPKDEADKIEIALTDNEEMGYYEEQALAELIAEHSTTIDLSKYSVHLSEPMTLHEILSSISPDEVEEDEAPELDEEVVSVKGKIYAVGQHRVICGDATSQDDMQKLMSGKRAKLVFTDPPYNINYEGGVNARRSGILNDNMSKQQFYEFLSDFIKNTMTVNDGAFYICMGHKEIDTLKMAFEQNQGHYQSYIIWVKNKFTLSGSDYQNQYEVILYGWKEGKNHYFLQDRGQGVVWYELDKKAKFVDGKTEIKVGTTTLVLDGKVTGVIQRGKRKTDIWEYDRPTESKEHPTMKPIKVIAEAIKNSSLERDIVLDTFLGSGSTLIACEQTNRICYGMELDPKYVDVIRKRYAKYVDPENWEERWQEMTPETAN